MQGAEERIRALEAEITRLRQLAAEPTASYAERYEQIFDAATDAMLLLSEKRVVVDCNPQAARLLGRPQADVLGHPLAGLLPLGEADPLVQELRETAPRNESPAGETFKWSFIRADRQVFFTEVSQSPLRIGQDWCQLLVVRDVTLRRQTEIALKESESRFSSLMQHAPVLMKMANANNYFFSFNQQWLRFTGCTEEEVRHNGWLELIHEDDRNEVLTRLDQAFKKRRRFELSYRVRSAEGTYRWLIDTGVPYQDNAGRFKGYIACAIDVTDRRVVEEQQRYRRAQAETEKNLQDALRQSHLIGLTITQEGQILACNPFFLEATGWTHEEVVGKKIYDFLLEDAPGRPQWLLLPREGEVRGHLEVKLRTAWSSEKVVLFNVVVLGQPMAGEPAGRMMLIGEDITEQIRVTEALRENNRQLQDLFDNAHDLIQVFSLEGEPLFVNRAWCQTLGYDREEVPRLGLDRVVHPECLEEFRATLEKARESGKNEQFRTIYVTRQGRKVMLNASINCEYEQGQPVAFRGFLHDITEQARSEQTEQLYGRMAAHTAGSLTLDDLYQHIDNELSEVVDTRNFYIALREHDDIAFAYYRQTKADKATQVFRRQLSAQLARYAIHFNNPLLLYGQDIRRLLLADQGAASGQLPEVWLGVPLRVHDQVTGVIAIQSYHDREAFNERDLDMLNFISEQVAVGIQRKQAEEKISRQAARLQAIFDSGTHLIWSLNRAHELTSFNRNFEHAFALHFGRHRVAMGKSPRDFLRQVAPPDMYQRWVQRNQRAFAGQPQRFELSGRTRRGKERWYEFFLNPIRDNKGQVEEISGIALDITQKKQDALALQESEVKFRAIYESFQDIYFRTTPEGIIEMISPSVEELCGYEPEQILGKMITEFYVYNVARKQSLRQLWRLGSIRNFEVPIIHQDGRRIDFICNIRLLRNAKGVLQGIEGVARDITELRRATREAFDARTVAEQSLRIKEQFLANMSHEIRTPMNGIIGVMDLLSDTPLDEQQRDYVETVQQSSDTLLAILNDILDISKIEAGKMKLRLVTISPAELLDKLVNLFRQRADTKGLVLRAEVADDVPPLVQADDVRLMQVLANLVSNAIKFTEKGSVVVRLSVLQSASPCVLRVEVCDTGIGIRPEQQSQLFNTFSQLDNSATKQHGGTGLGLVISKELARLMSGDIGVTSQPDQGSTFWFTFRTRVADPARPPEVPDSVAASAQLRFDPPGPRVLLVDDNQINRKVAGEMLRKFGCRVETAHDGQQALDQVAAASAPYDVVLMDIQMPRMDGVTATEALHRRYPDGFSPIIAMTAYSMQGDEARFLRAGMQDYLPKPIKAEKLYRMIHKWTVGPPPPATPAGVPAADVAPWHDLPVLDAGVMRQLQQMIGNDMTQDTYSDFVEEATVQLVQCQEAAARKDYTELLGLLHTLKGNAGTLGAERLAAQTREMEAQLRRDETTHLMPNLQRLHELFDQFKTHIHTPITPLP